MAQVQEEKTSFGSYLKIYGPKISFQADILVRKIGTEKHFVSSLPIKPNFS